MSDKKLTPVHPAAAEATSPYRPRMTQAGLTPTHPVTAVDEFGDTREVRVAGEFPLTLYVDER